MEAGGTGLTTAITLGFYGSSARTIAFKCNVQLGKENVKNDTALWKKNKALSIMLKIMLQTLKGSSSETEEKENMFQHVFFP